MSMFIPHLVKSITSSINNSYVLPDEYFFKKDAFEIRALVEEENWKDRAILSKIGNNYCISREVDKVLKKILLSSHTIAYYNYLYDLLEDDESKLVLIEVVSLRLMGADKFQLSMENAEYQNYFSLLEKCKSEETPLKLSSIDWSLNRYDFDFQNDEVSLYYTGFGVVTTFFVEQYALRRAAFNVHDNDVILDCGGCWGDTAVYFAKAAKNTKVYSFEFVPSNIELFHKNILLNNLDNVELVAHPVGQCSNEKFYVVDKGPASTVSTERPDDDAVQVETLCIDDFCSQRNGVAVNFIKMDIEGAEISALRGAVATITKFKPRLAIALYHNAVDFMEIPRFIHELGVGYEFHVGHFTPTSYETILFAQVRQ